MSKEPLCRHLDPGLPASGIVRNKFLLFESLHQWYFVMAAQQTHGVGQVKGPVESKKKQVVPAPTLPATPLPTLSI